MSDHPNRLSDPLLGKMWKTKSARFNAHARLTAKHWLSTSATAILSFYLVVASLVSLVYEKDMPSSGSKLLAVVTVIISVFLIIITLLESARNYKTEADRMHKCALEISELYNRFQALTSAEADSNRISINDEYSTILRSNEINHKDIDFRRFELLFYKDFNIHKAALIFAIGRYIILWISEYWLYIALILGPPIGVYIYRTAFGF
jgi:hypothetical protein